MARTAIPARSLAICEVRTSCTDGSSRISSCVATILTSGNRLRKAASLSCSPPHAATSSPPPRWTAPIMPLDVVVTHAAHGKLDVIFRQSLRIAQGQQHLRTMRAARRRKPSRSPADRPSSPPIPAISIQPALRIRAAAVKFVVMFPPLVSGLTVPYPQRFPPVLPAREFYILGPLRPPVRLRSLIIVSLMRERELPEEVRPCAQRRLLSHPAAGGFRSEME